MSRVIKSDTFCQADTNNYWHADGKWSCIKNRKNATL